MDKSLAEKLIAKKLINETTEITARYKSVSISGDQNIVAQDVFTVDAIHTLEDKILFEATSTRKGERMVLTHSGIVEIDGMEPNRFAAVYNIKADGSAVATGKRRGRKPKDRTAQIAKA